MMIRTANLKSVFTRLMKKMKTTVNMMN